ncbi:MAG: hypothetical protein ACKVS8_08090 [Phycisphaerales bacterium]
MTFRAVVQDGLIVVNTHGSLPDGTRVQVQALRATARAPKAKRASKSALPPFGGWKHRSDIKDAAAFARSLRRKTSRRGPSNG